MKRNYKKGYALLVTIVVVSVIVTIAIGLSKTTTTQIKLSSSARGSQTAFYMADTASECALYVDYKGKIFNVDDGELITDPLNCGGQIGMQVEGNKDNYSIKPVIDNDNRYEPCFDIQVERSGDPVITTITANGYNLCDKDNIKTVERTIQISY